MIQIITGDYNYNNIYSEFRETKEYTVSEFKKPGVFDDFKLNVLDLSFSELWTSKNQVINEINMIKDLKHYHTMFENNKDTKILVVLPQNITFKYYWSWSEKYIESEDLKNLTDFISKIVYQNVYEYSFKLNLGCNSINLNRLDITADF